MRSAIASTGHIIANCPSQVPKPAEATTSAEPPKTFDLPAIDSYVADQVREQGYAGLSLAIVRDGKLVLAKGYGKRLVEQGAPVETDTPFAIGSVTKQFICRLRSFARRRWKAIDRRQGREV